MAGICTFMYVDCPYSYETWKSYELVCETSMVVFPIRSPNYLRINDIFLICWITSKEGKFIAVAYTQ